MYITSNLCHFLCLYRPELLDCNVLNANLGRFAHFKISDSAILVLSDKTDADVVKGVIGNLPPEGINVIRLLGATLLGLEPTIPALSAFSQLAGDRKTVFSEPKAQA